MHEMNSVEIGLRAVQGFCVPVFDIINNWIVEDGRRAYKQRTWWELNTIDEGKDLLQTFDQDITNILLGFVDTLLDHLDPKMKRLIPPKY